MKTIKVITTVGTSLTENAYKKEYLETVKKKYGTLKKAASYYGRHDIQTEIDAVKEKLRGFLNNFTYNDISAEIKSLVLIQAQEKCKLEVYLICTDTILSVVSADMIKEYFEGNIEKNIKGYDPEKTNFEIRFKHNEDFIIKDLRVDTQTNYEAGFMRLIEVIDKIADKTSILNITGGYKAIIPILTLLGQLKEIPLKYIYEDSGIGEDAKPITIGNLPINFDWSVIHFYYPYYTNQNEFELNSLSETEKNDLDKIAKKYQIFSFDDTSQKYKRTIIGTLLNTYAFFKTPDSVQVVGFFVEYKFYEYFQNLYKEKYKIIERDYSHNSVSQIKYDIYLKNNESDFVLIECKSADQIFNALEQKLNPKDRNTYQQIENQFNKDFSGNNVVFPKEYHLYFYFYGKQYPNMQKIQKNLNQIGKFINDFTNGSTKLISKYIELNVNLEKDSDSNQFKSFMQNPFENKKLSTIEILIQN